MRIVLYARVSKACHCPRCNPGAKTTKAVACNGSRQEAENQLRELRAFVERKATDGWVLSCEYVDKASGKTADRPAFRRMLEDASRKQFDLVLFWALDRFSREGVLETLQHLQRLSSNGVEWFSYREEYLRSVGAFREAVLAILAAVAKQERVRISERTIAGLERARVEGKTLGRRRLVIDKARVREMHGAGQSMREIAGELNVSAATICRILNRA